MNSDSSHMVFVDIFWFTWNITAWNQTEFIHWFGPKQVAYRFENTPRNKVKKHISCKKKQTLCYINVSHFVHVNIINCMYVLKYPGGTMDPHFCILSNCSWHLDLLYYIFFHAGTTNQAMRNVSKIYLPTLSNSTARISWIKMCRKRPNLTPLGLHEVEVHCRPK